MRITVRDAPDPDDLSLRAGVNCFSIEMRCATLIEYSVLPRIAEANIWVRSVRLWVCFADVRTSLRMFDFAVSWGLEYFEFVVEIGWVWVSGF